MSTRPRGSAPSSRFASIAPLPSYPHGHYLRRSGTSSQSDCSESNSDLDESDDEISSSGDESDGTSDSDRHSSTSVSSQDAFDHSSGSEDDDLDLHGLRIHDSSSMHVQRNTPSWHSDNLGILALLIPITGVSTMILTELLACANHFDCTNEYPTLSYAAEFKPEGHAFTLGMCLTSIFILVSVVLFHWFLRLKLLHASVDSGTIVTTHYCLVSGVIAAGSLFGLAVFDMGAYHDTHIMFTVLFFIAAWTLMVAIQAARRRLLRDYDESRLDKKPLTPMACTNLERVWLALQRWKRISVRRAYQLGQVFLYAGLSATGLFALLFLCVNGMWPNPLGFTAVQEALLEAFAIFCQLFFMGTLSCELSKLTRVVEHRDYEELERAE